MDSNSINGPTGGSFGLPRRGSSRLYLFCLVGMTVFLLAVIASGSLLSIHQAETTVFLRTAASEMPALNCQARQAQLLARDNLLPALTKIGLDEGAAPRVTVEARRGEAGEARVNVTYTDFDNSRASALVNELAERCAAAYRRQLQQYLSQQVEQTLLEKQRLDQEIRQFLEEMLPKIAGLSADGWKSDPWRRRLRALPLPQPLSGDGAVTASAISPNKAGDDVDPDEIRRELAEQDRRLAQMREYMTDEHPDVQRVLLDIQQLEASLLSRDPLGPKRPVPTPASQPPQREAPATPTNAAAPPPTNLSEAQAAAAATLKGYRERFAALNTRHASLARAEHAAWEQCRSLEDSSLAQIEPVRHTMLLDRERWQRYLALVAAMAGTLGLGMVWLAKRGDRAFYSARQVGRELALPVVGALGGNKLSAGRVAHGAHRGIRTACEGLLAIIAIWLGVLAAMDHSFLDQVSSDPLAAIALAWPHMLS